MPEATVTLRMICGCLVVWGDRETEPPICTTHGERSVGRLIAAPPPRIRAVNCPKVDMGPLVTHVEEDHG